MCIPEVPGCHRYSCHHANMGSENNACLAEGAIVGITAQAVEVIFSRNAAPIVSSRTTQHRFTLTSHLSPVMPGGQTQLNTRKRKKKLIIRMSTQIQFCAEYFIKLIGQKFIC